MWGTENAVLDLSPALGLIHFGGRNNAHTQKESQIFQQVSHAIIGCISHSLLRHGLEEPLGRAGEEAALPEEVGHHVDRACRSNAAKPSTSAGADPKATENSVGSEASSLLPSAESSLTSLQMQSYESTVAS